MASMHHASITIVVGSGAGFPFKEDRHDEVIARRGHRRVRSGAVGLRRGSFGSNGRDALVKQDSTFASFRHLLLPFSCEMIAPPAESGFHEAKCPLM